MKATTPEDADLVVVVVTYNSASHLPALMDSLPAATAGLKTRIIIVDNDSSDNTKDVASRYEAQVLASSGNLGFSGGINVARAHAGQHDALAIVNPDAVLQRGCISELVRVLRSDTTTGIAVPLLLAPDGRVHHHLRRETTVRRALGDALFGGRWPRRPSCLTEVYRMPEDYERTHDVAWAGGAVLVVSSACDAAVGPWDSGRFFMYAEETDYARRARENGFRVRFVPTARAVHHEGGSGRSTQMIALMSVNRVREFEGSHPWWQSAGFRAAMVLQHLLRVREHRHRTALLFLIRRSSWEDLPSATGPRESSRDSFVGRGPT